MTSRKQVALLFLMVIAALVAAKASHFADPPFWDENTYVRQARFVVEHGRDWAAYQRLSFVRPPLYSLWLALPSWLGWPSITLMHALTCILVALLLPVTYALTRRLGGSARAGWLAAGLLLATPLFIAQVGLAESDGPVALLTTLAWLALLDGRVAAFGALAVVAVWTKESAYFLCGPAALLLYARSGPLSLAGFARRLWGLWPAAIPGAALVAWLVCHRLLHGDAVPGVNSAMVGPSGLPEALLHNCVKDGRLLLFVPACLAARRASSATAPTFVADVRLTLVAALSLPFFFMAPLPRYMLPSLPLFCALAALTLASLPRRRTATIAAVVAVLIGSWYLPNGYSNHGLYFDRNLGYRGLLATEIAAVRALAEEHPRRVLATFPIYDALVGPPSNHYLPAPVPATEVGGHETMDTLCAHDWLVRPTQSVSLETAFERLRGAGALTAWRSFGTLETEINIYRVSCKAY